MSSWEPTQAELERKLGGANILVELADPNRTGTADAAIVESYLANGRGRVRGAVQVKHEPEALDTLSSDDATWIRRIAVVIAAWTAWSDGSRGESTPPRIQADYEIAEQDLERLATGQRRVGRATSGKTPALTQVVGPIDQDPTGALFSMNGFKRGFR